MLPAFQSLLLIIGIILGSAAAGFLFLFVVSLFAGFWEKL